MQDLALEADLVGEFQELHCWTAVSTDEHESWEWDCAILGVG